MPKKPNIIIINPDQWRGDVLGHLGNPAAVTIAFVHFLFNVIGVLFIYPIRAFRAIPINLAKNLGNLAFRKRRYAFIYVLTVFFIVPGLLILISKIAN